MKTKAAKRAQDKYRQTEKYKITKTNWWYKLRYDITMDEFDAKIAEQNNMCPIGPHKFGPKGKHGDSPCLDHNHATKTNRGILCRSHNQALGICHDDIKELQDLINYLNKWQEEKNVKCECSSRES